MTKADYEYYDYIIAMDRYNLHNMKRFVGNDEKKKVSLMMDYTNRHGDVADPWYTGDFETAWNDICEGCKGLFASTVKYNRRGMNKKKRECENFTPRKLNSRTYIHSSHICILFKHS